MVIWDLSTDGFGIGVNYERFLHNMFSVLGSSVIRIMIIIIYHLNYMDAGIHLIRLLEIYLQI